jgi:hypothetical protein
MTNLGESNVIVFAVLLPLGMAILAFWVWMLVDLARNKKLTRADKKLWAILLVVLRPVGALLYYFKLYRPRRLSDVSGRKAS